MCECKRGAIYKHVLLVASRIGEDRNVKDRRFRIEKKLLRYPRTRLSELSGSLEPGLEL